jgi:hypothetical protein
VHKHSLSGFFVGDFAVESSVATLLPKQKVNFLYATQRPSKKR